MFVFAPKIQEQFLVSGKVIKRKKILKFSEKDIPTFLEVVLMLFRVRGKLTSLYCHTVGLKSFVSLLLIILFLYRSTEPIEMDGCARGLCAGVNVFGR